MMRQRFLTSHLANIISIISQLATADKICSTQSLKRHTNNNTHNDQLLIEFMSEISWLNHLILQLNVIRF